MTNGRRVLARDNPLAMDRTESLAFHFTHGDWSTQLTSLAALNYRGAIVGPQGSGKTTLLEQLQVRLAESGIRCRLARPRSGRCQQAKQLSGWLDRLVAEDVLLLDSAEQLNFLRRAQLLQVTRRRGIGLVVTVHRPGWLPTWIECRTTERLLRDLLLQLNFDPQQQPKLFAAAQAAFAQRGGNIREVFRTLYDQIAQGRIESAATPVLP